MNDYIYSDKSNAFQISVQIFRHLFVKYFFMDFTNRSKTELCKAFKQALGLLATEFIIELKAIDAKSGIATTDIRNARTKPTPEDVEAIDAAYPGFKDVFLDYLEGGTRWSRNKTEVLREAANKSLSNNEEYWKEMFLRTNEELKQVLYDKIKKE